MEEKMLEDFRYFCNYKCKYSKGGCVDVEVEAPCGKYDVVQLEPCEYSQIKEYIKIVNE